MPRWVCNRCSTRYKVGLDRCPACTAETAYIELEEQDMPKNTLLGGPSFNDPETGKPVNAPVGDQTVPGDTLADTGQTEEPAGKYDEYSKTELQDELSARGLATSGNKAELVAKLEEDDSAKAATNGDAPDS